jgi:hypothetical protein
MDKGGGDHARSQGRIVEEVLGEHVQALHDELCTGIKAGAS